MSATTEYLSGVVESLWDHFAAMSKAMETLTAKISEIESNQKLQSSTVAQKKF